MLLDQFGGAALLLIESSRFQTFLVAIGLAGGLAVTWSSIRLTSADDCDEERPLFLARRLIRANVLLITVNTVLGLVTAAIVSVERGGQASWAPIIAAAVVLPFIIGSYALAVALISLAGIRRSCVVAPVKPLVLWAWGSIPLSALLWLMCIYLVAAAMGPFPY